MDPLPREERASPGNRGSRLVGSAWVVCSLRQSDIYQLVEEFSIPPEFVVFLPPPNSHLNSPHPGYMSFFVSQLRVGLRFPIHSFFREVSRDLQVPLNQLVPNSIRLLAAFSIVLRYNNLIPTSGLFCQCFQLKRTEPGVFHFAPRRGVSFLPTPSPPKYWKGDFFFILPPLPWNIPHRWIYESPPSMQVSLADRSSNFCRLLDRLNEKPYDCKELVDERLLSHFGLSPRVVPLREPLDDIMFSKYLRDEHRAALTHPATRSSRGTPSSSDQRALPSCFHSSSTSSSKRPRCGIIQVSAFFFRGGVYTLDAILREGWGLRARVDVMKGALPAGDKRLLSSLSFEDLDRMLTLVLTKGREFISSVRRVRPVPRRGFCEGFGGEGGSLAGGSGRPEGGKKGGHGEVSEDGEEVKRLQREAKALQEEHAEELRAQADQVHKEFPKTEEGKNLLEVRWASRLAEHKKSDAY
ncbi:UNVERIFIED_CONTAM: hypothetical protein Slati_2678800 [Sesamum latifolium]|uniref:Transposase (putative) gypsy type domain-containing protein n=1 Tax=Sesamum latifolium TaxID=2727402 RepID=A0AAW2VWZ8_9LAMI